MQFVVCVSRDGAESTLGPFDLETAEATVRSLAIEPAGREPFYAYARPVPDDVTPAEQGPAGVNG